MSVEFKSYANEVLAAIENAKGKALETIGGIAEGYAADLAPYETGRLSNSIDHRRFNENTEIIFTNVEYAPYQELGTSKIKAQPYMRPAIENHLDEYKAVIKNEFENA